MRRAISVLIVACLAVPALPASAEEKDEPLINFWSTSQAQAEPDREQWKPRVQNALELLQNEDTFEKEEKVKKSDKVWVIAFGTILAAGLVGSVVMNRENARGGDGSIRCSSRPHIPGRKPPTVGAPHQDPY